MMCESKSCFIVEGSSTESRSNGDGRSTLCVLTILLFTSLHLTVVEAGSGNDRSWSAHNSDIIAMAFSPDDTLLATSSADRTVKVWSTSTGALEQSIDLDGKAMALAFSPSGTWLAMGMDDGLAIGHRISDWSRLEATFKGSFRDISDIAFSPNGSHIAISGPNISAFGGQLCIWKYLENSSDCGPVIFQSQQDSYRVTYIDSGRSIILSSQTEWTGDPICEISHFDAGTLERLGSSSGFGYCDDFVYRSTSSEVIGWKHLEGGLTSLDPFAGSYSSCLPKVLGPRAVGAPGPGFSQMDRLIGIGPVDDALYAIDSNGNLTALGPFDPGCSQTTTTVSNLGPIGDPQVFSFATSSQMLALAYANNTVRLITDDDAADSDIWFDDDGDGFADHLDAFPSYAGEWLDTDGDGQGDNSDADDDNDGIADSKDPCPNDMLIDENGDHDSDGCSSRRWMLSGADVYPCYNWVLTETSCWITTGTDDDSDADGLLDDHDPMPWTGDHAAEVDSSRLIGGRYWLAIPMTLWFYYMADEITVRSENCGEMGIVDRPGDSSSWGAENLETYRDVIVNENLTIIVGLIRSHDLYADCADLLIEYEYQNVEGSFSYTVPASELQHSSLTQATVESIDEWGGITSDLGYYLLCSGCFVFFLLVLFIRRRGARRGDGIQMTSDVPLGLLPIDMPLAGFEPQPTSVAPLDSLPEPLPTPSAIVRSQIETRFTVGELLAEGGMALVFRATRRADGGQVIWKQAHGKFNPLEIANTKMRQEAELLQTIRHPRIPDILGQGIVVSKDGAECFVIVQEFIEGGDLRNTVDQVSKVGLQLPLDRILEYMLAVCEPLEYMAAQIEPIYHRDIKPHNIIIHPQRGPVLIDFGLAKMVSTGQDVSITRSGSGTWTPPERDAGVSGPFTDVFSLGKILYLLLTNQTPDAILSQNSLNLILQSGHPEWISHLVHVACWPQHEQRIQSVQQFRIQLENKGGLPDARPLGGTPTDSGDFTTWG